MPMKPIVWMLPAGHTSTTSSCPEYRWGKFLAEPTHDRRIGFGDFKGQPVWQEVPGEFRTSSAA